MLPVDRNRLKDQEYIKQYLADRKVILDKQQVLIAKFLENHPNHPKAGEMFLITISAGRRRPGPTGPKRKIDIFLAAHPDTPVRKQLIMQRTLAVFRDREASQAEKGAAVDKLASQYPDAPVLDSMRISIDSR